MSIILNVRYELKKTAGHVFLLLLINRPLKVNLSKKIKILENIHERRYHEISFAWGTRHTRAHLGSHGAPPIIL